MSRSTARTDPLAGTDLLIVDATNLVHVVGRMPGGPPAVALVGRIRGLIPPRIGIELVFDGPPERGLRGARIASGVSVRHAGRSSADEVIVERVVDLARAAGPAGAAAILVVTNDRELGQLVRARGVRTVAATWLAARLGGSIRGGPASHPAGHQRGEDTEPPSGDEDPDDRPGWKPGRGATTKRGNPRRAARRTRGGSRPL